MIPNKLNEKWQELSNPYGGFALLITLVVVSVILAIGLSLLFVTTRQYLLAVTATESEKAFQASQIGLECMRYWRADTEMSANFLRDGSDATPALECAGVTSEPSQTNSDPFADGHWLYRYDYDFDLAGGVCLQPSIYIADMREYAGSEDVIDIPISGQGLDSISCTAGAVCTAIFSRGYNRPCSNLDSIYSIQREITIQY